MITVWGRVSSTNVQKVLWTLEEMGLPYERIECGREYGGLDTPEFRAMNPNGRIPVMRDWEADVILWESNTICRYLCRTRENFDLYPKDPARAAEVEKWMDWQMGTLWPTIRPMFFEAREKHDIAVAREERFADTVKAARRNLRILNEHLETRDFLGGDAFTLADMPTLISLNRWLFIGFDFEDAPHVQAWYEKLYERKPCQDVVKASF